VLYVRACARVGTPVATPSLATVTSQLTTTHESSAAQIPRIVLRLLHQSQRPDFEIARDRWARMNQIF
jgi:hypothetical protein